MNHLDEKDGMSRLYDLGMAILLYLPTLFFIPALGYLLPIAFFFLFSKKEPLRPRDSLIIIFVGLALLNVVFGMPFYGVGRHGFPLSVIFVVPCLLVGRSLRPRILKYLVYLTLLECVTVVYEVLIHRTFLFAGQAKDTADMVDNTSLLYFFRPYGLSANSSGVGIKIFVAILLVYFLYDKLRYPKLILMVLFACCFLNFNRTAMASIMAVTAMIYGGHILSIRRSGWRTLPHALFLFALAVVVVRLYSEAIFQLTYGSTISTKVLSGRSEIWHSVLGFIQNNPLFGNHSMSFHVDYMGKQMHSHNSYLQLIATHGLIGLLLLVYALLGIRRRNLIFVLPILLFSVTQYGIFWNFSYLDAIFFFFVNWEGGFLTSRLVDYRGAFGAALDSPRDIFQQS